MKMGKIWIRYWDFNDNCFRRELDVLETIEIFGHKLAIVKDPDTLLYQTYEPITGTRIIEAGPRGVSLEKTKEFIISFLSNREEELGNKIKTYLSNNEPLESLPVWGSAKDIEEAQDDSI